MVILSQKRTLRQALFQMHKAKIYIVQVNQSVAIMLKMKKLARSLSVDAGRQFM